MTGPVWHVVTGEYPPAIGGVADHTRLVAAGLAARGAVVHIWAPGDAGSTTEDGVCVHRVAGAWAARDLEVVSEQLGRADAGRVLVQWVPHAYGQRSLNVGFCRWVRGLARQGAVVEVMVHEPSLGFREGSLKQDAAAALHRWMLVTLLRGASRVWLATPSWEPRVRPWLLGRSIPIEWLPVPSNIAVASASVDVRALRARHAAGRPVLVGHFGTFGAATTRQLEQALSAVLERSPEIAVLLIGRDGDRFAPLLSARAPADQSRVSCTGPRDDRAVSCAIQACDVMLQPFGDGASMRRTTLMAALAHARATVTTIGRLSEPLWALQHDRTLVAVDAADAPALAAGTLALAADPGRRARLGEAARALYDGTFALHRTLDALLQPAFN